MKSNPHPVVKRKWCHTGHVSTVTWQSISHLRQQSYKTSTPRYKNIRKTKRRTENVKNIYSESGRGRGGKKLSVKFKPRLNKTYLDLYATWLHHRTGKWTEIWGWGGGRWMHMGDTQTWERQTKTDWPGGGKEWREMMEEEIKLKRKGEERTAS